MHRILVDEKRWFTEDEFLHALNFCMLLPGPEAQQLVTYAGWRFHSVRGGLTAGLLFVLPGAVTLLILSWLYVAFENVAWIQALFFGVKAAVLAVVLEAVVRIGKRALKSPLLVGFAAASFLAMFVFQVSFPWIVGTAAVLGWGFGRILPGQFPMKKAATPARVESAGPLAGASGLLSSASRTLGVAALWLAIWFAPVGAMAILFGTESVFVEQGLFFSKTAVVTFGGAYAVLAYLAQEAVQTYGWVTPGEMQDGLGLAETTPGPLIMVVQFVAFVGAFRQAGTFDPWLAAVLGSAITTWVTFAPSFLWIFVFAPYLDRLRSLQGLSYMLSGITAAVVGAILNLSAWFTLHTLFGTVAAWHPEFWPQIRLWSPDWSTLDGRALLIAAASITALFRFHVGMLQTLGGAAALGLILQQLR
jgi:chromate transporter